MAGNGTSLKGIFQEMVPPGATVLQGKVIATGPLKIQITNDDKLVIGESITIVPWLLTDYTTTVDISIGNGSISGQTAAVGGHTHSTPDGDTGSAGGHSHGIVNVTHSGVTMTVHNALKVGDTVHVLAFDDGKKYFVLDRV